MIILEESEFYTVSAELVYDGIKTHTTREILYDAHYNIEMSSGHGAATHNIVITELVSMEIVIKQRRFHH